MKETDLIDEKALKMCKEKRYEKCECNKKKGDEMIKLTEVQITRLDITIAAINSMEEVLKLAMKFYAENMSKLKKEESDWWDEIAKEHGMDMHGKKWRVSLRNRTVVSLEDEKK